MFQRLQQKLQRILVLVLAFVMSSYLFFPQPAAADPISDFFRGIRTIFAPPRETAPTGRRQGGGGRGPLCPAFLETSIKALVPSQQGSGRAAATELVWGRTTEEYPTLWFYVPYPADTLKSAKLVVMSEDKQLLPEYPLTISLVETPGIISVRLPSPLAVNKLYRWYFSVTCSTDKPSRNPSIRGWMERIEPASGNSYEDDAKNGVAYDLVTNLIHQYQLQPERYLHDWLELLEYLDAKDLSNVSLSRCCTTTSSQSTHRSPNIADAHTVDSPKVPFEPSVMPSL